MTYFIIVILLSSGIIYGAGIVEDPSEINGSVLSYIDALFLSCSAMTTTGEPGLRKAVIKQALSPASRS